MCTPDQIEWPGGGKPLKNCRPSVSITYPTRALCAKVFSEPGRPAKPADRGIRAGAAPAPPDARITRKIVYLCPVHVLFRRRRRRLEDSRRKVLKAQPVNDTVFTVWACHRASGYHRQTRGGGPGPDNKNTVPHGGKAGKLGFARRGGGRGFRHPGKTGPEGHKKPN